MRLHAAAQQDNEATVYSLLFAAFFSSLSLSLRLFAFTIALTD